ncbi:DUF6069 family protein [Arthrobacter antioxidans]|uniref:DUF6069 family protein n=1 Tax=Arthrobacter antioxidans TaxID=2895818 RepID=UPI00200042FB|nr:DUF6069 family protein [Arthrobacter antioxidans]
MTGTTDTADPAVVRVIALAVAAAVVVNLVIFFIGALAGGTYAFTSPAGPATVNAAVVAAFTIIPLTLGLTVVAVTRRWWPGVVTVALIVAPIVELGTIVALTIPADFDGPSTVALALCHVTLVPVTVLALRALRLPQHNAPTAAARTDHRKSGPRR